MVELMGNTHRAFQGRMRIHPLNHYQNRIKSEGEKNKDRKDYSHGHPLLIDDVDDQ